MANIPISSFTAAANQTGIGMSGYSLTGANTQSMLDLSGTWNTTGTPTALKLNVTDTASNASSLLMDLQVGGSSKVSVNKAGDATATSYYVGGSTLRIRSASGGMVFSDSAATNSVFIGFASMNAQQISLGTDVTSPDVKLFRDAANTLALRNSTNAQAFNVYNSYTDASNYERGFMLWSSNVFQIGTEKAGTGTARNLQFRTDGVGRWLIDTAGHFTAVLDNTYDIGAAAASRPRNLFLGGGSLTGSQATSSLTISPTWNTTGTPTAIQLNVTDTASNAASLLMDLQVGGSSRMRVDKIGNVSFPTSSTTAPSAPGIGSWAGTLGIFGTSGALAVTVSGGTVNFSSSYGVAWNNDLFLQRDGAANTLALRNSTNAQAFNVYNTYTDASNYERGFVKWSSSQFEIGYDAAGTGSAGRLMVIRSPNTGTVLDVVGASTIVARMGASVTAFAAAIGVGPNGSNPDIFLFRRAAGVGAVTANASGSTGASLEFLEQTAPAAPAADRVRIYAEDNGAGKTRLMALFATGSAVQLAVEP